MINWKLEKENLENLILIKNMSYEDIGKIYNCTGGNIKKQAKKLGIVLPERRKVNIKESFNKGKRIKFIDNKSVCPICGNKKYYSSKLCKKCANEKKYKLREKKLGDFIGYSARTTYLTHKCSDIRKDARKFMENESKQEKVCAYCKNHEYDEILEVHHLKSILEFSPETKISEINSEKNLVWLCPNHHRMIEKGLITLNGVLG